MLVRVIFIYQNWVAFIVSFFSFFDCCGVAVGHVAERPPPPVSLTPRGSLGRCEDLGC